MQSEIANTTVIDAVLVQQYRRGNSEAMQVLILKYQNRIYNLILKMCENADDAAELTQETFVKAMDNIERFEDRSNFYTWLFRIAINLTINHCQRYAMHGLKSLDTKYNENINQANVTSYKFLHDKNSPDPSLVAQNKELCLIVVKLLMKLDIQQRAVVLLHDIEGMKYAEIAKILDIKLGTVKSRINRARKTLREILDIFFYNNATNKSEYLNIAK